MKAVKSIVGGVAGVVGVGKKIISGVKKVWKSVTGSTFGRVLLIAATIYLGGAALGYWNSPFQAINGAWASPAAEAAGATTGTAATEAGTTLAEGASTTGTAAGTGEAAAGATANDAAVAETMTSGSEGANLATQQQLGSGMNLDQAKTIGDAATTYGGGGGGAGPSYLNAPANASSSSGGMISDWWAKQPDLVKFGVATTGMQAGGQMISSAFSPDAIDVAERQAQLQRENEQWRNEFLQPNFNVSNVNVGRPSGGQMVRDANGNMVFVPAQPIPPGTPQPVQPQGFIQSSMAPR